MRDVVDLCSDSQTVSASRVRVAVPAVEPTVIRSATQEITAGC